MVVAQLNGCNLERIHFLSHRLQLSATKPEGDSLMDVIIIHREMRGIYEVCVYVPRAHSHQSKLVCNEFVIT